MKRIVGFIVLAFFLTGSFPAQAQIKFGVKGGVNISKVHFNENVVKASNLTGFQIGPVMELMAPYSGFGFETGILYSQKGMEFNNESFSSDYLDIPINVKLKMGFPVLPLKGYIAAGPYFGFRVGGDKIWKVPGSVTADIKSKNFNTGLNLGAGLEVISHLQVGFNYGFGLTDTYESTMDVGEGKNRTWSITAAILF